MEPTRRWLWDRDWDGAGYKQFLIADKNYVTLDSTTPDWRDREEKGDNKVESN